MTDHDFHEAPVLEGAHVRLEPMGPQHAAGLLAAADSDEIFRWLTIRRPTDLAEAEALVTRYVDDPALVAWAQVDVASGEVAGATTYYDVSAEQRTVAIGFTWLGRRFWRSGVNTEAKLLLLTRAFDDLGCVRVVWHTDELNQRSRDAIARLGATPEGILRKHRQRLDGSWRDTAQLAMTDDDWPALRRRLRDRLERGSTPVPTVVGVDSCPGGWVAVTLGADGSATTSIHASFEDLLSTTEAKVVGVDIPIGLPETGSRASDQLARKRIGPRSSSVFPAPLLATLDVATYAEAREVSRAIHGKALSAQAFAIVPKIREVKNALERRETGHPRVLEVHPEVSFATIAGEPLAHSKHTAEGLALRERLLERAGIRVVPGDRPRGASHDDLLDAAAVAWSARRVADGTAERLPPGPDDAPAIWT